MSDVKRWPALYHPLGSLAGPEVAMMVLASDYDALMAENARLKQQVEQLTVNGVHTCHDECQRVACVLRREVEKLKAERDEAHDLCVDISNSAAMYLAEIDRLREALRCVRRTINPIDKAAQFAAGEL